MAFNHTKNNRPKMVFCGKGEKTGLYILNKNCAILDLVWGVHVEGIQFGGGLTPRLLFNGVWEVPHANCSQKKL